MRAPPILCVLGLLGAMGCDPTPLTQVSVLVDADSTVTADTLEVNVYDDELVLLETQTTAPDFPREIAVYRVARESFVLEILALQGEDLVAAESLSVTFDDERIAFLETTLSAQPAACPDDCDVDERCPTATCEGALEIDAADLPDRP